jgi:hypothetical protein
MLTLLSRIPADKQQQIAKGLVTAAGFLACFALLFVIGFTEETDTDTKTSGHLWWKKSTTTITEIPMTQRVTDLLVGIGLLILAAVLALAALRLFTMQGRFKRYLAILTGVESMKVQQIADITGSSSSRVRSEIQSMIDSEMISDFYLDYQGDQVVSKKYIPKTSHKTVVTCTGCGGRNELIVGITRHCTFCGEPLVLTTY